MELFQQSNQISSKTYEKKPPHLWYIDIQPELDKGRDPDFIFVPLSGSLSAEFSLHKHKVRLLTEAY